MTLLPRVILVVMAISVLAACGGVGSPLSSPAATPTPSAWPLAGDPCSLVTTATVSNIVGQPMGANSMVGAQECVWSAAAGAAVPSVVMRMISTQNFDSVRTAPSVDGSTTKPQTIPGFDASFVAHGGGRTATATVYARRGAMALLVGVEQIGGDNETMATRIVTVIGSAFLTPAPTAASHSAGSPSTIGGVPTSSIPSVGVNGPPICGTVAPPGASAAVVAYVDALHEIAGGQTGISTHLASENFRPSNADIDTQVSIDQSLITRISTLQFGGQTQSDLRQFIDAIGVYDDLLRTANSIRTPQSYSGYNQYSARIVVALNARRGAGNLVRADLHLPSSTCIFSYP